MSYSDEYRPFGRFGQGIFYRTIGLCPSSPLASPTPPTAPAVPAAARAGCVSGPATWSAPWSSGRTATVATALATVPSGRASRRCRRSPSCHSVPGRLERVRYRGGECLCGCHLDVGNHADAFPVASAVGIDGPRNRDRGLEVWMQLEALAGMGAAPSCFADDEGALEPLEVIAEVFSTGECLAAGEQVQGLAGPNFWPGANGCVQCWMVRSARRS